MLTFGINGNVIAISEGMTELRHGFVITQKIPEIRLHFVETNNHPHNPLVIFLHGFPEHWYSWRKYLTGVAVEGVHGLALDLRGYNESSRPLMTESYGLDHLVMDLEAVIQHFGNKPTYLVGHGWGGILTWELARRRPELLKGIVVINASHVFLKEKKFFMAAQEKKFLTHADIQVYKEALAHPEALMTAISYSRANAGKIARLPGGKIYVPTLLIKGESKVTHEEEFTEGVNEFFPKGLTKRFYVSSPWVHLEYPQKILNEILYFFSLTRFRGHSSMAV